MSAGIDHLVGAHKHRRRNFEAERAGRQLWPTDNGSHMHAVNASLQQTTRIGLAY
jgi:hypothetical protein